MAERRFRVIEGEGITPGVRFGQVVDSFIDRNRQSKVLSVYNTLDLSARRSLYSVHARADLQGGRVLYVRKAPHVHSALHGTTPFEIIRIVQAEEPIQFAYMPSTNPADLANLTETDRRGIFPIDLPDADHEGFEIYIPNLLKSTQTSLLTFISDGLDSSYLSDVGKSHYKEPIGHLEAALDIMRQRSKFPLNEMRALYVVPQI